jgi:hypothetical protein
MPGAQERQARRQDRFSDIHIIGPGGLQVGLEHVGWLIRHLEFLSRERRAKMVGRGGF